MSYVLTIFCYLSYFLLLFLSRSSHFFFLHSCAYLILSPDSFFVPVIYYLFRLHVYISLIKYYLSPKVFINLCSSISLNVSLSLSIYYYHHLSHDSHLSFSLFLYLTLSLSLIFNLIPSPHISTLLDT